MDVGVLPDVLFAESGAELWDNAERLSAWTAAADFSLAGSNDLLNTLSESGFFSAETIATLRKYESLGSRAIDNRLLAAVPWDRELAFTADELRVIWFDWARFKIWDQPEETIRERIEQLVQLIV